MYVEFHNDRPKRKLHFHTKFDNVDDRQQQLLYGNMYPVWGKVIMPSCLERTELKQSSINRVFHVVYDTFSLW